MGTIRRFLCILRTVVALLMLAALPVFGSGAQEGTGSTPAKAPIKVVAYNNSGGGTGVGSEAGSNKEDYEMVQKYILEKTGVLVESMLQPKEGSEAKLAMLLAGGDQLDLWWGDWRQHRVDGMIQPLNDLIKDYGQDVWNVWQNPWKAWVKTTASDGTIWAIPRYAAFASYFLFVREDWLKQLGMSQPTTLDQFEKYLYAVKKADPYGKGQTIPLIHRGGTVASSLEWVLLGGFTEPGRSKWLDANGNVMPKELAPGYRDFIATLAKWYADGITHKENFGWDVGTLRDHIVSGKVGASASYYTDVTLFASALRKNNKDARFTIYEPGVVGKNGQMIQTMNPGQNRDLVISSKTPKERAIAAMKVINWTHESWYNYQVASTGIEGVHWNYLNVPNAKEHKLVDRDTSSAKGYFSNFCFSLGLPFETQSTIYDPDGVRNMHNLFLREHVADFHACKTMLDGNVVYDSKAIAKNVPRNADINRTIAQELVKFVMGQRPMSEWDAFVQSLYSMGLNDWIKEHTRQYNAIK